MLSPSAAGRCAVGLLAFGLIAVATKPGHCSPPFVIQPADNASDFVGYYGSLALDAMGNSHVSYYDEDNGNLKYARKSGGTWTPTTVDNSSNTVGLFTSIAIDGSGNPHISYYDDTNGNLL